MADGCVFVAGWCGILPSWHQDFLAGRIFSNTTLSLFILMGCGQASVTAGEERGVNLLHPLGGERCELVAPFGRDREGVKRSVVPLWRDRGVSTDVKS